MNLIYGIRRNFHINLFIFIFAQLRREFTHRTQYIYIYIYIYILIIYILTMHACRHVCVCVICIGSLVVIMVFICREEKNLVFCFGALFNSTLNFTQSGWLIPFSPDLHFRLAKRVSGQNHSLRLETATRTDLSLVVPA